MRRWLLVVTALMLCTVACSSPKPEPVKTLGTPRSVDDVTGIWRTVHQNTLEFRKNGTFVLITTVSDALAGKYTLDGDRMTVFGTSTCGDAAGTYRIQVAVKDHLVLTEPDDGCKLRRTQLTADTYVYAQPDYS